MKTAPEQRLLEIVGPPLPRADAAGNVPAVAFARATLARKLIRDRRRIGLTQAELARRARMTPEMLCRIEKGKVMPDPATFNRIHRALERAEREDAAGTPRRRRGRSKQRKGI